MRCDYFDAGRCRSCGLLELPYAAQLARKQELVAGTLSEVVPAGAWLDPVPSREEGFRNKAKMVVGGTVADPTLGILGPGWSGVDLRACGLHTPGLRAALPTLAEFVTRARLEPYSVSRRRGELKHVIATESPDGELMVRWVLRSTEALARIRSHLRWLQAELPGLAVASVNLQPEHKAVLEGPDELLLTERETLAMRVNTITLRLHPQSFFQTNTDVAAALYAHARDLVANVPGSRGRPLTVWDLYCGVGGFGLHLAGEGRRVVGVESSRAAIDSAATTAAELGLDNSRWLAEDATAYSLAAGSVPDLVVVNPPRRGIGAALAGWLQGSGVGRVLYSSCNASSLARDLAAMPDLRPVSARLLDMFPHTEHHEVLVSLVRG